MPNTFRHSEGQRHPGRWAVKIAASLCAIILLGSQSHASSDDPAGVSVSSPPHAAVAQPANRPAAASRTYFIEFRSRSAESYGHTFSIFGRLNGQGKVASMQVAGLHPISESPIPWMIGHLVLVPSETGASDGDTEDQYVTARFRVVLNASEYQKVTGFIKQLQDKSPVWHAVLYNCNAWVGDIAKFMGLKTPGSTMAMPEEYITELRELNINRQDMASIIGVPVKVADAATLRAEALRGPQNKKPPAPKLAATTHKQNAAVTTPSSTPVQ